MYVHYPSISFACRSNLRCDAVMQVSYAGVDGCCNGNPAANGEYTIAGNSSEASSGLPYIQLLTCLSQAPTFDAKFPGSTLLFNEVGCPPSTWQF
jgi:hypothetical protein